MKKKMIIFDADGTLLDNQTDCLMGGFKDILVVLGKGKEVQKIDKEYQKKKHQGPWGLEQLAGLYKGFSKDQLQKTALRYIRETLMEEARECLRALRIKGFTIGTISSNPQFLMDALNKIFSLDFSEGTQLEFKDGKATGEIKRKVDRYVKAEILKGKMRNYGIKKRDVVVVGDSITDLPMAELAGTFIAFCPKEYIVKQRANFVIKTFRALTKGGVL